MVGCSFVRALCLLQLVDGARRALPEHIKLVHDEVLRNPSDATCGRRLRELRSLISSGDHGAAVDLSFALDELRASRELPADCHADAPFVGSADVTVEIKTPRRRGRDPAARPRRETKAALRHGDGSVTHHPYAGPARGPARDEPVVGAVVDGVFVTSDRHAPARDRRPASRVDDKYSKKILGDKTMLVTVICPSSEDCDTVYDYEVIASDHDGDVISYLEEVVAVAQDFWTANSWGNFTVDVTITPILEVDYDQSTCEDNDELDWYGGNYDGDPDAFDVMAAYASLDEGYDREEYDFNVVVVPYCSGNGAAGTGYVSQEGAFLNLGATNYDPSFIHEVGHNFGANHASYVDNDSDDVGGVNAWYDDDDDWIEYGNLFTPMGSGDVSSSDLSNHFTVEAKATFDWLLNKYIEYVAPYDDDEAPLCNPCTYTIQGTDTGSLDRDYPVALQVSTATDDQFLFVEYRSSQGGALLTYSGFSYTSGMSGKFGNTRMVLKVTIP